jgi:hypothetical protein
MVSKECHISAGGLAIISLALAYTVCGKAQADTIIDPYYAGGAIGKSSEELFNAARIGAGYLHAHPIGGKLLIGARPRSYIGGEFEVIDFGRGNFGASGDVSRASSLDIAAAAFIVGYLPLFDRQFDLFAKIGGAVYRSSYKFAGDFSNECLVNTATGICTPLSDYSTSGTTSGTGFAFGAGMQIHMGHYAIRAEYERIARPTQAEQESQDTTMATGLGLISLGVTYGF